ncbi:AraC family transcriptional regulator [Nocardia sputorum]|uniref:AraC family transcriptional regulator n=1 Tax=Nocardia sputorum TaxID=2984338 RepID=A0ABN6UCF9_9NOCA|nr:AraC family transcriptional regulator [Nocardia sputorum]BDU02857.1 AraC family transcriptional regulator [Nocardia sputorum]
MSSRFDPIAAPVANDAGTLSDPLDGTASTHLTRLVRDTAADAGVRPEVLAAVPGTDDATLTGELNRIPLRSVLRLWDLLAHSTTGPGAGLAVAAAAPLGTLTTWDYLVTNGPTLADALRAAEPYHRLVTAAAEELTLNDDGPLSVAFRTTAPDPATAATITEYVLAYYLRRAREATGRPVVPERVVFSGPAPADHRVVIEAFGTDRIEFGGPVDAVVFAEADARAPLVRADPRLAELLRSHADLVLATARPIAGPLESFRIALAAAIDDRDASLGAVARRLAVSTRSLQRRLSEQDTTWRAEYDLARYERARVLLAEGRSTTAAIAGRLGFADDRALRKAYRRWSGSPPSGAGKR